MRISPAKAACAALQASSMSSLTRSSGALESGRTAGSDVTAFRREVPEQSSQGSRLGASACAPSSLVIRASRQGPPRVEVVPQVLELDADEIERIASDDEMQRGPIRFQRGDSGLTAAHRIAPLFSVPGEHTVAGLDGSACVSFEAHAGLCHRCVPEIGPEWTRLDDRHAEAYLYRA